jgi:ABC-type nickel/cobalt efflux system permease component RcnA
MHAISLAIGILMFVLFFSCVGTTALFALAVAIGTDLTIEIGEVLAPAVKKARSGRDLHA